MNKIIYLNLKSSRRRFKEKRQARSVAGCRVQCSRDAVQGGRSRVRCRLRLHAPGPPHALPSSPHVSPPTDLTCFDVRCPPTTMQNLCRLPLPWEGGKLSIFALFASKRTHRWNTCSALALLFKVAIYELGSLIG